MFALGLLSWLYHRPLEGTRRFLETKFGGKREVLRANLVALEAGWSFGETTEGFAVHYEVKPAGVAGGPVPDDPRESGVGVRVGGGVRAVRVAVVPRGRTRSPRRRTSCTSCPALKHFGVRTFQAEDEIAGVAAALGASYGGSLGVTTTSGPGVALKAETIGLAVTLELPLIVVDVQRGGPSTGLPTKTEQADLLQVMFGRNGEAPVPVIAAQSASDCFDDGVGGRADRDDVPDPGVPAVRRVPGERVGAVADPGCGGVAGPAGEFATEPNHGDG